MGTEQMRPQELPFWGLDVSPEDRPGVPREAAPHPLPGAHWTEPERQPAEGQVLTRAGLRGPTPVFSTALPPRGVSGALRRIAYGIPDHRVRHWLILMLADRVDAIQNIPALFNKRVFRAERQRGREREVRPPQR